MKNSIPDGIYTVTVSKPGYLDKNINVAVNKGELAELNVELEKIP